MLTSVMSALAEEQPLLRAHRLYLAMGRLSSRELAALFASAVRVGEEERRNLVLASVLARWNTVDPSAAAAAVRPYLERFRAGKNLGSRSVESSLNRAWAQARPEVALSEAFAAPMSDWASATATAALETLAGGDPARQLEFLQTFAANRLRDNLCVRAIDQLLAVDPVQAESWLYLVADSRLRQHFQGEILGQITARDPSAGIARLIAIAPDLPAGAQSTIRLANVTLRAAAKSDPTGALAALDGLPENLRTSALGAVLIGWAEKSPAEALGWALANHMRIAEIGATSFSEYGGRTNTLLSTAAQTDRAATLAWVRAQPASRSRDAMLSALIGGGSEESLKLYAEITPKGRADAVWRVTQALMQEGMRRAEAWVEELPPGRGRATAIQTLVSRQAASLETVDAIAEHWAAGADRDAALLSIVNAVSQQDSARALDFARRMTDPDRRIRAIDSVASMWLYRDRPAARAWIASTTELNSEQRRVLLREAEGW